jgi:zinc/manganese transport system substrate-binding protein
MRMILIIIGVMERRDAARRKVMGRRGRRPGMALGAMAVAALGGLIAGCGGDAPRTGIQAVAAENQYADVIAQIGGRYVSVTAIESNPDSDPHSFEASASVAHAVATAQLVVQNGVGYDSWMGQVESANPRSSRKVVDVQKLLGLPDNTPDPHLWYDPGTMPKVGATIAADLEALAPDHAAQFRANLEAFDASLDPWRSALARLKASFAGSAVAVTEPVADYLISAAGLDNVTPWAFQADVMNGVDPSAQDVSALETALSGHGIKAFLYNRQVTDSLTQSLRQLANRNGVPVVAVYETMPAPGYHYQSWMAAETLAIQAALASGRSTTGL